MNSSCGYWLRCQNRRYELRLSNNEFCVALCLRYGLRIPFIREFDKCPCCQKKLKRIKNGQIYCKVDAYGHHLSMGCRNDIRSTKGHSQGAQPHAIHDAIRSTLHRIAKHAMATSYQEPKGLLFVPGAAHQLRPDLEIRFSKSSQSEEITYAVDTSLVCPFKGSFTGVPEVEFNGEGPLPVDIDKKYAIQRTNQKIVKYREACQRKGVAFVPFVLTSTGKVHKEGVLFLSKLADLAVRTRGISSTTALKYYLRLMNVAIIKQVTRVISLKVLESRSYSIRTAGLGRMIRTGNAMALDAVRPQMAVHYNPRADN